ncbi:MAG: Hsp70 family protein [Anaerolineae bacterium]|nr:Hsp70 family protein [Anaerolineae bacterium]
MALRIGVDFGTTNSGAAVFDGRRVHLFPIDPKSADPAVVRSAIYITREHEAFVGQEAIDTYYRQNIGRPSRMVRQYIGEIEMVFAELPPIVKEVYVMVDELTPGRLLHSLKSELVGEYAGTTIFGRYYALEELIAIYLGEVRRRVEAQAGQRVDSLVLGRPVNFTGSQNAADNRQAEDRLRRAAGMAGFEDVTFEMEPIAAALHYELTVQAPQNVVVFDFGGGTLDITVMRIGEPGQRQVFATGGVGIAGDVFDQRIIAGLLLDHFGRGSTWGENGMPFPSQYTDALVHWQTIAELHRPETLHFLQMAQITGSHPARVRALESLLVNNYAIRLINEVERAKVALSTKTFATVRLTGEDIDVWQPVTRTQFEALIAGDARRIETCLLDTLGRSGLDVGDVDTVVRTGGSAQIPAFIEMVGRIFGPEKVVVSSVFSGVTAGLAVRAHES